MRKQLITICCLIVGYGVFGQDYSKEYVAFKKIGDSLYKLKDYKNAATFWSLMLNVNGRKPTIADRYSTACSWSLANYPDSAFSQLNSIAAYPTQTFKDFVDITNDEDFIPIQNDKRWQEVLDKMCSNAYKTLLLSQAEAIGEIIAPVTTDSRFIRALGYTDDSAISHLNDKAYIFLRKKMFTEAYKLFKVSINNFYPNYILYSNMVDYYIAKGDKGRAYIYFSRAEVVKYRHTDIFSDTLLNIDSTINADYLGFSKKIGDKFLPPEYLINMVANTMINKGRIQKAYRLFKTNIENYPTSYRANSEMGNFYEKAGDKEKANEYHIKGLIMHYSLPKNFFQLSFDVKKYIISRNIRLTNRSVNEALTPEIFANEVAYQFLLLGMFSKAEMLYKMNVRNYPHSMNVYKSVGNYYKTTNDKMEEEKFVAQAQAVAIRYGTQSIFPDGPIADTTFNTRIKFPACKQNCPTILFDQFHDKINSLNNFGAYNAFVNMMANDGFKIQSGKTPFIKQNLAPINLVVFTGGEMNKSEMEVMKEWIRQGGSLLVLTHHDGGISDEFLQSLGVETQEINITLDTVHGIVRDGFEIFPYCIVFSGPKELLKTHPIMKGRNISESIRQVNTFSGRTIIGPAGCSILLRLRESAVDFMTIDNQLDSRVAVKTGGIRSLGIAFNLGKGKVVVTDAGALSALLFEPGERGKMGMSLAGSDNRQFALNIVRWLTGYLN